MRTWTMIAVLTLAGCANSFDAERMKLEAAAREAHPLEISAPEVFSRTKTQVDPHRNIVTVEAPHVRKQDQWVLGSDLAGYSLNAQRANRRGAKFEIWLSVVTSSSSWKHFTHAYSFGKPLDVKASPGTVGACGQLSCSLFETANVTVTLADLERGIAAGGYELLIAGSGGELKMQVPTPYIRGFLDAIRANA